MEEKADLIEHIIELYRKLPPESKAKLMEEVKSKIENRT